MTADFFSLPARDPDTLWVSLIINIRRIHSYTHSALSQFHDAEDQFTMPDVAQ